MSREVELGCESWTSFASGCPSTAVQRTLSLWLRPARQLKQQLRSALVAAQWRGDTALTLPLSWRRSTVSPVFFGQYPRTSLQFLSLFPRVSVPNKQPRFCGREAKWSRSIQRNRIQELCESRGDRPGLSVLTSLMVSVDVKQHWTMLTHWSQLVPNMSTDTRGH